MNPQNLKKKPKISPIWIIPLVLVVILLIGSYLLWNETLFGKSLPDYSIGTIQVQTQDWIQTFTPLAPQNGTEISPTALSGTPIPLSTPTLQPTYIAPVCGQIKPMTILVLGIDENEQADVIRIVRVDFDKQKILVFSIPRDFWVPIPGMKEHGITQGRINATYGYGEYFDGKGQGVVELSLTLYQNYGLVFDRYVIFHFSDFEQAIDAVGGVDINLDEPVGAYDIAGVHHFDGKTALDYVRMRYADSDIYRIERQSVIITSLFQKLILPENLIKIPFLGFRFLSDKTLISDISIKDVHTSACFTNILNGDSLVFRDIPLELYTPTTTDLGAYIDIPSPGATTYIQDLVINGNY
jgi:LCP family protein required for cell wall assembly